MNKIIIHISGASGSGKTTLGLKLKEKFKGKIIVKDLDDLRDEFIKYFYGNKKWTFIDEKEYQKYIDKYIKRQKKTIIFVGLNDNILGNKQLYYNIQSQYNYYIKLDDETIMKQKCQRFLRNTHNNKEAMNDLIKNNKKFMKLFTEAAEYNCNTNVMMKENNKFKKYYKKQGYIFMSRENIYKSVSKIISKNI